MSADNRPILAPLDERRLQSQGLASPNSADGTRKLHRRRMNRSSDSENEQIPLNVSYSAPNSQSAFVTIPTFLISKATLLHVGFTETKASRLWDYWNNWPGDDWSDDDDDSLESMKGTFLEFMTANISRLHDTTSSQDQDWTTAMTAWGIKPELQEAMIDPMFNSIRHSESAAFWVKDTIKMRYAALEQTQRTSAERNALLARGITAGSIERQFRAEAATENARAAAARNAPGCTILYKAIDEGRVENFVQNWDAGYLDKMRSSAPSDFTPIRAHFYFSPQRFVAQYYAAWVTRRNQGIEARPKAIIIQFSMPNSALESLSETEKLYAHFPDDEWKQLIWYSRKGHSLPTALKKYHNAILIIGTISRGDNAVLHNLHSWEQVSSRNVLKLGPPGNLATAIQFAFTDENGHSFLEQHRSAFSKEDFNAREYREWQSDNRL